MEKRTKRERMSTLTYRTRLTKSILSWRQKNPNKKRRKQIPAFLSIPEQG